MKLNRKKKGFTIVELVIVIAVVAVLSAILIPTFVNLVHKANVSADQSLVKNLNISLKMEEAENGAQPTMHDTLTIMEYKYGYVVSRLSPTAASNDIVWDSKNNQFVLIMNQEGKYFTGTNYESYTEADYYKLWKIYNAMPESSIYSIYLAGAASGVLNVNGVGIDVGNNTGVTKINYLNTNTDPDKAKTIAIRTNDAEFVTELNVDAETDTVNHYGYLTGLEVVNVDTEHSYHEYGKVLGRATILAGHFVAEEKAEVGELVVAEEAAATTSVEVASNSTVKTLVVENENVAVEVKENAKVETVVAENTTNVTIPTSVAVETITKTYVSNEDELRKALEGTYHDENVDYRNAKYIVLNKNIDVTTRLTIDRDLTIDGTENKYELKFTNENISNGRAINIGWDNTGVDVVLKNLKITGPTGGSFTRGLNVGQVGTKLLVDNCEVTCKYYAINIISNASDCLISINNSKVSGWAAINLWSSIDINVTNSELIGTSISKNEGFATICFEADTTQKTDLHVSDAKITVYNSKITAKFDYTDGDGYQAVIGYNYYNTSRPLGADHNEFEAKGCDIVYEGSQDNLILVYDYCAISSESSNITIIDGRKISSDTWYCER